MNKKERKKRMREREEDRKSMEEDKKRIKVIGITVGGPAPGVQFQVNPHTIFHKIILPNSPHYSVALYIYTKQFTATNEMIATFLRCIKREEQ